LSGVGQQLENSKMSADQSNKNIHEKIGGGTINEN
jgi:hypothetical protein